MIKLLLVEDELNLSYIIKGALEDMIGGYEVITATNGQEGLIAWKKHKPYIIITDIEMPIMNGLEMVSKIRETDTETLILFASGKGSAADVITAYKLGGNNYVKKPFMPEELDAHIRGMLNLRNELQSRNESQIQKIGSYTFDALNGVLKHKDNEFVPLTSREANILQILVANIGNVVKRESFIKQLWDIKDGEDFFASRSLDVFISKMRKKLSKDPSITIKTVRGIGLLLSVEN